MPVRVVTTGVGQTWWGSPRPTSYGSEGWGFESLRARWIHAGQQRYVAKHHSQIGARCSHRCSQHRDTHRRGRLRTATDGRMIPRRRRLVPDVCDCRSPRHDLRPRLRKGRRPPRRSDELLRAGLEVLESARPRRLGSNGHSNDLANESGPTRVCIATLTRVTCQDRPNQLVRTGSEVVSTIGPGQMAQFSCCLPLMVDAMAHPWRNQSRRSLHHRRQDLGTGALGP